jgi:hypothetical protein
MLLLGVALAIDTTVRRYVTSRRQPPDGPPDLVGPSAVADVPDHESAHALSVGE